ncbi:hypothetical protein GmHk_20G056945 [Glycine max]|nr:hypothetical protein GmHk_20G056945 [Glycine max]
MPIRSLDVTPTPSPPLTKVRPSPSSIDTCGPSPVPTSTPSPSPTVVNMHTDEDEAMEELLPPPPPSPLSMIILRLHLLMERWVYAHAIRLKEFEARLSQAVFDVVSSVGESQLTPLGLVEEQRLRTWCWGATAGPKRKGHLYGSGDFVHTYKCGDDNFMQHTQGSSSRTQDLVGISRLREELRQSKEEIHAFQSVVLQFLSPEA